MNYAILMGTALFRGISETEIGQVLDCLGAEQKQFDKGQAIFRTGDTVRAMGLVLSGGVNIIRMDVWGNQNILDHVGPGQVFAETYACAPAEILMVDVTAAEDSEVLFLDVARMLEAGTTACAYHVRVLRNLLSVMASKNLMLTRKMGHISPRSIRERLLSYLSYQALQQGKYSFEIPFNRQQLADYLSVERSALSNELSKMRKEGMIDFHKNGFTLFLSERPTQAE